MTFTEAKAFIESLVKMRDSANDAIASDVPNLYPTLKSNGRLIKAGTRINHNGTIKKASVDLWDTIENDPDNAPTLWEDILYRDGIRIIPDIITTTTAFSKDEKGWWGDTLYVSLVNANIYTPVQYPNWWKIVEK